MTTAAPDILDLVASLKSTHQPGDLYRGQQRDFPVLLASFFRKFATDLTLGEPIAELDGDRFQRGTDADLQTRTRFAVRQRLVRDFGAGFGNIIAQQYGLSSHALDVTTNIDVAAYFATRDYPSYAHHTGPGFGVIYRFRGLGSDDLPETYGLRELSAHLSAHLPEEPPRADPTFERRAWSKRLVSDWPSLQRVLDQGDLDRVLRNPIYLGPHKRAFSWKRTRFEAQSGGLIRPRVLWAGTLPESLRTKLSKLRSGYPFSMTYRRIVAVENLRANSACQAFPFQHSAKRVTGFYRRELWPEPADDPLYGALWQVALAHASLVHGGSLGAGLGLLWDTIPAVDHPTDGILDRGYRLTNEIPTRDARDDRDLYRGQLEDSLENEAHGPARATDQLYRIQPLLSVGDVAGATRAAIAGLRLEPNNVALLTAAIDCFAKKNKPIWAQRALEKALSLAPNHPILLYRHAVILTRRGEFSRAIELVERGISHYDFGTCAFPDSPLLELRGVLAWVTRDIAKRNQIAKELTERGETAFGMMPQVEWLVANLPELDPEILDMWSE